MEDDTRRRLVRDGRRSRREALDRTEVLVLVLQLQTPASLLDLYAARGEEVETHRPLFTGDVFDSADELVQVVQHPCALRRGPELLPRLLVVPVRPCSRPRSDWANADYKTMPLPALLGPAGHHEGLFAEPSVIESSVLVALPRVATLAPTGVDLLLQRFVHHSSRVIVPIDRLDEVTSGPFEEADLHAEWVEGRRTGPEEAALEFDTWIREEEGGDTRQSRLDVPAFRSTIRRALRAELKKRNAQNSS
ncbi:MULTISPECIES: hypothetical protein [unclassified Rathayibacter]|uniref:hypothetical protein n=1 Tax=unclassified Rathayibacter TaxID=2609250 RepID=UPI0011CE9BCD|nr:MULTISPECIES: hypothetical protein [unclassified Rathayibacter]